MIPNKSDLKITDNLNGSEEMEVTIDPTQFHHIMELLTTVYPNSILASIREYATNARDSHVEAGVDRPIEITLPTRDESVLSIRDFGLGLSKEEIANVYLLYGASTKRETNDLVGAMGIGSKSAMAYADQFTVIATKNEVQVTVLISRREEGGAKATVVSEEEIPYADNGVEIIIPVQRGDVGNFRETANNLFRFWDEGTVLIDGREPARVEGIKVTDQITAIEQTWEKSYIVMGGVPYEAKFEFSGISLIAEVPIGAVDFTPDRENLKDSKRNKGVIQEIKDAFKAHRDAAVQAKVDEASTKPEALKASIKWNWLAPSYKPTYKGEAIPTNFFPQTDDWEKSFVRGLKEFIPNQKGNGQGVSKTFDSAIIGPATATKGLWVTGYKNNNWGVNNRVKFDAFISANIERLPVHDAKDAIIVGVNEVPHAEWIDPSYILDWAEVKKFRLPRIGGEKGPRQSFAGTYSVYTANGSSPKFPIADIDPNAPLYYTTSDYADLCAEVIAAEPNAQIVYDLKRNRVTKFQRLFPQAQPLRDAQTKIANKWWNNLSDEERLLDQWDGDETVVEFFKEEDADRILDPEVRTVLKLTNQASLRSNLKPYITENRGEVIEFNLGKRYPLLAEVSSYGRKSDEFKSHALDYVNNTFMAFAAAKFSKEAK